eukprot:g3456.t1
MPGGDDAAAAAQAYLEALRETLLKADDKIPAIDRARVARNAPPVLRTSVDDRDASALGSGLFLRELLRDRENNPDPFSSARMSAKAFTAHHKTIGGHHQRDDFWQESSGEELWTSRQRLKTGTAYSARTPLDADDGEGGDGPKVMHIYAEDDAAELVTLESIAWRIHDADRGIFVPEYPVAPAAFQAFKDYLHWNAWTRHGVFLLLLITFIQVPVFCLRDPNTVWQERSADVTPPSLGIFVSTGDPQICPPNLYLSNVPTLNPFLTSLVQLSMFAVFAKKQWQERRYKRNFETTEQVAACMQSTFPLWERGCILVGFSLSGLLFGSFALQEVGFLVDEASGVDHSGTRGRELREGESEESFGLVCYKIRKYLVENLPLHLITFAASGMILTLPFMAAVVKAVAKTIPRWYNILALFVANLIFFGWATQQLYTTLVLNKDDAGGSSGEALVASQPQAYSLLQVASNAGGNSVSFDSTGYNRSGATSSAAGELLMAEQPTTPSTTTTPITENPDVSKFGGFASACQAYFFMGTTANFPDEALVAMGAARWTGFIFLFFMFIAAMVFTNLVLAIVYSEYEEHIQEDFRESVENTNKGLEKAFIELQDLCADYEGLSCGDLGLLVETLNSLPDMVKIDPEVVPYMFEMLDNSRDRRLGREEFFNFFSAFHLRIWVTNRNSVLLNWLENRVPAEEKKAALAEQERRMAAMGIDIFGLDGVAGGKQRGSAVALLNDDKSPGREQQSVDSPASTPSGRRGGAVSTPGRAKAKTPVPATSQDNYVYYYHTLKWLQTQVELGALDDAISQVLLVNLLYMILDGLIASYGSATLNANFSAYKEPVEFAFSLVYMLEVCSKVAAISFAEYWVYNWSNKFDFFTSVALFTVSCVRASGIPGASGIIRSVNIVRVLRLVRILARTERFRALLVSVSRMIVVCQEIICLLCVCLLFFASLGQMLWGGRLGRMNPGPEDAARNAAYYSSHTALNFNDIGMGMFTLLSIFFSNAFPDLIDEMNYQRPWPLAGASEIPAALGTGMLFCAMVWFVQTTLMFNLYVAFSISCIQAENRRIRHSWKNWAPLTEFLFKNKNLILHQKADTALIMATIHARLLGLDDDPDDEL